MKKEGEKKLLEVVRVVDAVINREKYGEESPYCLAIFHQTKRFEKTKGKLELFR